MLKLSFFKKIKISVKSGLIFVVYYKVYFVKYGAVKQRGQKLVYVVKCAEICEGFLLKHIFISSQSPEEGCGRIFFLIKGLTLKKRLAYPCSVV